MSLFSDPQILNSPRWKNMRVGLLGGSFNPPHFGHVHISQTALNMLGLDAVWWLVTPRNPLKDTADLLPLAQRVELSKEIVDHPNILISEMEKDFHTTYSYASISILNKYYPNTEFVWITGLDNAHSLHLWQNWKLLLGDICVAHIARLPAVNIVRNCPNRMLSTQNHVVLDRAARVDLSVNTTYWLLQNKMVDLSSTQLRNKDEING